jgi:exo-1,4-beta-D-glucosaminidase
MPTAEVEVIFTSNVSAGRVEVPVKLKNLSDKIAFFTELTLKDNSGSTILPVYWEDNYVTLLPGEERDIKGYVNRKDYKEDTITLGCIFWNME